MDVDADPTARPVLVVGAPASGQVAMRETLLAAPGTWRLPSLAALVDSLAEPSPDAVRAAVRAAYAEHAGPGRPDAPPRLVAADPALTGMVGLLVAAFPDAHFVHLHRDPAHAVPDAAGEATPEQWAATAQRLLDDLETHAAGRWTLVDTADLVTAPEDGVQRLFERVGLGWHPRASAPWRVIGRSAAPADPSAAPALPAPLDAVRRRVADLLAADDRVPAEAPGEAAATDHGLADVLRRARSSLLVSTYQSNRLMVLRHDRDAGGLGVHLRTYERPMGLARTRGGLALGTRSEVWDLRDFPAAAAALEPKGRHDACFVPRNSHVTGDIAVHELEVGDEGLWVVATKFSCLATLDSDHSFVPRWWPSFITALAPEDRCHLNGMALVDGAPRYVTALGTTDTAGGWRADKVAGGVLMEVPSSEVVVAGLSMPHSPRWHDGRLWVLESGRGRLSVCDPDAGTTEPVVELPGFTRGLRFLGTTAYVATSQVRETATFGGLPISALPRRECGVWAVDTTTGEVLGHVTFDRRIQEVFDVELLDGTRFPEVAEPGDALVRESWLVPPGGPRRPPA